MSSELCPFATPLAEEKLLKRLLKLVTKCKKNFLGSSEKKIKRGVKEVVKAIRKGVKGIVVLAADVSPIDVLTHIPVLCEEAKCKFVFVPSRHELGLACNTKRATCCVMILPSKDSESGELYEKCIKSI